ncbi:MAG: GIY-YIG nuclease family protein [Candidatus Doudnabacteria bacterium]|nr:GIY-YIG nuclease family protein [Candidatus Doudnabacteria bacterium]
MYRYYFYLLRTPDNTLYAGITHSLSDRDNRHNSVRGSNWTTAHGGGQIVYTESYSTLSEARKREIQIKKWSRIKKEHLIQGLKP